MPLHGFLPTFLSNSEEETRLFGSKLSLLLQQGSILALHGDLGSGKTTLAKGILEGRGLHPTDPVTSPTFSYLHIYPLTPLVFHFDLYRLSQPNQFIELGFLEYLHGDGICLIEWPEKITSHLPDHTLHIHLSHEEGGKRKLHVC